MARKTLESSAVEMRATIRVRRLVMTSPDYPLPLFPLSSSFNRFATFLLPALDPISPHQLPFSLSVWPPTQVHLRGQAGGLWRLCSDLLLSRNFTKLPNLIFLVLKIKQSSKSKHHRLTSQPKAEEKCLMVNFLAHNRIYEHFQCFHFFPQSLLFLTPQS